MLSPSLPGAGSIWLVVAPVQAMMAGCISTVDAAANENENGGLMPVTLYLTVGGVIVHVALPGMRLAPAVFMRGDILRFGKIGRAGIERLCSNH